MQLVCWNVDRIVCLNGFTSSYYWWYHTVHLFNSSRVFVCSICFSCYFLVSLLLLLLLLFLPVKLLLCYLKVFTSVWTLRYRIPVYSTKRGSFSGSKILMYKPSWRLGPVMFCVMFNVSSVEKLSACSYSHVSQHLPWLVEYPSNMFVRRPLVWLVVSEFCCQS